jgi:DNA-binding transcriptional ArsR family regulator
MVEFSSEVVLEDIVVRDPETSAAVDDPVRASVLDVLDGDPKTVAEVHENLSNRGVDRSENTIRHHVNKLRDSGLVEVARMEEGRGGTTKYYKANTVVLSYTIPDDVEKHVSEMVEGVSESVAEALDELETEYSDNLDAVVSEMKDCEHCSSQKKREFVALTVLRRSLVRALSETRDVKEEV